jgi:UDP-glucose 4-epimerase
VKNFERIRDGLPVIIKGDGEQSLDYLYVKDAVDGIKLLANYEIDNKFFNISSSIAISINNLLSAMEKSSGRKVHRVYEPADWTSGSHRFGDNSLIRTELGWTPRVKLNEGLNQTWDFVKSE